MGQISLRGFHLVTNNSEPLSAPIADTIAIAIAIAIALALALAIAIAIAIAISNAEDATNISDARFYKSDTSDTV
eukprot:CAMPEP_0204860900 /NCGR_PEP_ID=MMETSP1348-20121228/1011_1 /ASSEMBLY_ACC=CAM_ASM_000700 /TAXON_ID=215587 /ORGANISM="Aplanochytrium stocchinoi, Strain GSBS06" /LENGTH=74 /DNA_ID=CAMNT_0052009957 /DNA_START=971 /DNA_END=1195 /DNA_ORIENTATION=-